MPDRQAIAANIEASGRDILTARQNLWNVDAALDLPSQNARLQQVIDTLHDVYEILSDVAVQIRKASVNSL
jgi:hypothetical protein